MAHSDSSAVWIVGLLWWRPTLILLWWLLNLLLWLIVLLRMPMLLLRVHVLPLGMVLRRRPCVRMMRVANLALGMADRSCRVTGPRCWRLGSRCCAGDRVSAARPLGCVVGVGDISAHAVGRVDVRHFRATDAIFTLVFLTLVNVFGSTRAGTHRAGCEGVSYRCGIGRLVFETVFRCLMTIAMAAKRT